MKEAYPAISVIMSVYNSQRYVAAAVESILAQTFEAFEFLIVDDGSTDRSRAILQSFASWDSRIRLVSRPNTGLTAALNEMLALATGKYIARMDADDISMPDRFQRQINYLEQNPTSVAVGSGILWIDPDGAPVRIHHPPQTHREIDEAHLTFAASKIYHPAAMVRTSALREIGGYDESLRAAQDIDIFLRLAETGDLANLEDILLQYRFHFDNISNKNRKLQVACARQAVESACIRRGLPLSRIQISDDVPSGIAQLQNWIWWALRDGYIRTARKHAWRVVKLRPFAVSSWKLLAHAIRGH